MKPIYNTTYALTRGIKVITKYDSKNKLFLKGENWHTDYESARLKVIKMHEDKIKELQLLIAKYRQQAKDLKKNKEPIKPPTTIPPRTGAFTPVHKTKWAKLVKKSCPDKYKEIIRAVRDKKMKVVIHELINTYSITATTLPGVVIYSDPNKRALIEFCARMRWKILRLDKLDKLQYKEAVKMLKTNIAANDNDRDKQIKAGGEEVDQETKSWFKGNKIPDL